MTTAEAAAVLNVSQSRIRQMILAGHLRAVRHGRDWWIEPQDIESAKDRPTVGYPKGKPRKVHKEQQA